MSEVSPKCSDCTLFACPVNRHCTEHWKALIEGKKSTGYYQKRQVVFKENNIAFGIYILFSGKAKIYSTISNKGHQILRFIAPGDCLGLSDISAKIYHASCSTMEDSALCFIDRDFFIEIIENNPGITSGLLDYCTKEILSLQLRFRHLTQIKTHGRIAEALLLVNSKFGVKKDNEKYLLDIDLTRQDIANIACTAYAQAIRILSDMKKQKIIETDGHHLRILRKEKLLEMVLDHCSEQERINYSMSYF